MRPLLLRGVPVMFPHTPYDQQVVFMERVLEALQESKDALLESPTGTGKTICLLAASLSWLEQHLREQQALGKQGDGMAPKIIYASRTHSQLSKVIAELKRSAYNPRMTVMGSRQQLCVHPQVEAAKPSAKNGMCRSLVNDGKCRFYDGVQAEVATAPHRSVVVDIEDMLEHGKAHSVCPYYLARERCSSAEIAFMPYNYLIDSSIRKVLGAHDLEGSVLIFDEAHNLDAVCADAASFELTEAELVDCISSLTRLIESGNLDQVTLPVCRDTVNRTASLLVLLKSLANGEHTGVELVQAFSGAGFSSSVWESFVDPLDNVASALASSNISSMGLQALTGALSIVYEPARVLGETPENVALHYRTHVAEKVSSKTFSYWCFHPGIALRVLRAQHRIRCVLLASGTLSPMESFSSELGSPFPVRLENTHVIRSAQVWAGVVTVGPAGNKMDHSFGNRNTKDYLRDLGSALVNFARVTPQGLLVFFPSYSSLDACVSSWQDDGTWASLLKQKLIVVEPRQQHQCNEAIADYQAKIGDGSSRSKGAMFLAVCRGKVSEGLDFADANGRAVVIVGIPNPNVQDPKVTLKKRFLDTERRARPLLLSGDDWYNQQASCAVNQAVGRIIRHRLDYGAMIFLDCRFAALASNPSKPFVSAWIRPYVRVFDEFGPALTSLSRFFQKAPQFVEQLRSEEKAVTDAAVVVPSSEKERKRSALASPPPDPAARKKLKMAEAKAYLELAKEALGAPSYASFQECLRQYKAQERTSAAVWGTCLPLFLQVGDANLRERLFTGFEAFLPPAAHGEYRAAIQRAKAPTAAVLPSSNTPKTNAAPLREVVGIIEARARARAERRVQDGAAVPAVPPSPIQVASQEPATATPPSAGPRCPVCQDTVRGPFSAKCGHVCCYSCWNDWLDRKLECPVCKEKVRRKHLNKLYF